MSDKDDVIKGLEKCKRHECDDCAEKGASQAPWDCPVYDNFVDSALALLKKQEAVEPINSYGTFRCGNCRNIVGYNDGHWRGYQNNFCSNCGQGVKWDEDQ